MNLSAKCVLGSVLACASVGCAFGGVRTASGKEYDLSGAERVLADRWTEDEPKQGNAAEKCDYWTERLGESRSSDQTLTNEAGVIGTNGFAALRKWTLARAKDECASIEEQKRKEKAAREQELADERKRQQQQLDEQRELNRQRREEERQKLQGAIAKCDNGDGDTCYELAGVFGRFADRPNFLEKGCELKHKKSCDALATHMKATAEAEKHRTRRSRTQQAQPVGPMRDLSDPRDVEALRLAVSDWETCSKACLDEAGSCIRYAPEYGKAEYVKTNCEPPLNACQKKCELQLNSEGFCLAKNVVTGNSTGAVGPCPR